VGVCAQGNRTAGILPPQDLNSAGSLSRRCGYFFPAPDFSRNILRACSSAGSSSGFAAGAYGLPSGPSSTRVLPTGHAWSATFLKPLADWTGRLAVHLVSAGHEDRRRWRRRHRNCAYVWLTALPLPSPVVCTCDTARRSILREPCVTVRTALQLAEEFASQTIA
jgi:hypothetical protein